MSLQTTTTTKKANTANVKDYRASELVREFYKFLANNNLRETAHRGLKAAIKEKRRITNSNTAEKAKTVN